MLVLGGLTYTIKMLKSPLLNPNPFLNNQWS